MEVRNIRESLTLNLHKHSLKCYLQGSLGLCAGNLQICLTEILTEMRAEVTSGLTSYMDGLNK